MKMPGAARYAFLLIALTLFPALNSSAQAPPGPPWNPQPLTPEEVARVEDAIQKIEDLEGSEKLVECLRKLLNAKPRRIFRNDGSSGSDGRCGRDDSYKCKDDVIDINVKHLDGDFWDCWTLAAVLVHEGTHARHRMRHETDDDRIESRSEKYSYSAELPMEALLIAQLTVQIANAPPGLRELLTQTKTMLEVMQAYALKAVRILCEELAATSTSRHLFAVGHTFSEDGRIEYSIASDTAEVLITDTHTGELIHKTFKKIERPLQLTLARRGGNVALYVVGTRANDTIGVVEVFPAIVASHGNSQPHVLEQLPGRQISSIAVDEATDHVYVWDQPAGEVVLLKNPQPIVVASVISFQVMRNVESIAFGPVTVGGTPSLYAEEVKWSDGSFEDASPLYRLLDTNGDLIVDGVVSLTYRETEPRAPAFWHTPQSGEARVLITAPLGAQVTLFSVSTNQPLGQLTMPFRQPAVMQLQAPLQLGQQVILIDNTNNFTSEQVQVANQFAEAFDTDAEIIEADGLIHIVEVLGRNLPSDVFATVDGQFAQSIWVSPTRVLVFAPAQPGNNARPELPYATSIQLISPSTNQVAEIDLDYYHSENFPDEVGLESLFPQHLKQQGY